jgi:hypothetical protein
MALVLSESFDSYNGTATDVGVQAGWSLANGTIGGVSMVSGRIGGQALRIQPNSTQTGNSIVLVKSLGQTISTNGAVGFAVNPSATPSALGPGGFCICSLGLPILHVRLTTSNTILVQRVNSNFTGTYTTIATSPTGVFSPGAWSWVELEFVLNTTTGSVNAYVNDNLVASATGANTGGTSWDSVACGYGNNTSITMDFDDIVGYDVATRPGQRRVKSLRPASDVLQGFSRSTGTANYPLVNESTADGDTSYVQGGLSALDRYIFDALGLTPGTIDGIKFLAFVKNTDVYSRLLAMQVKSGSTISDGPNYGMAVGSYGMIERLLATDPNTSAAWAAANVPPQGGPKVTQ